MRRRGEEVNVWNRTPAKAKSLESDGAHAFDEPAAAAADATHVHLSLSDDAAVDAVLARARPGLRAGTMIIDHTTTAPRKTAERIASWNARGFPFVHAPVFMGPQNALESTGTMLVSGARALVGAAKPRIEPMTGKVIDLGDRPDLAAAMKLLGNLHLMFLTSGLADLFTLARAMEVPPRDAAKLFDFFNPGTSIHGRIDRMLGAAWSSPSWELGMARKDARLMLEEAARAGEALAILPTIAARMDDFIARGHATDDWTVLAKDALR
jgi:3-hydroxyisobutyrate dehydrogenase